MKDPEATLVEYVANRYWMVSAGTVPFDILNVVKLRRNVTVTGVQRKCDAALKGECEYEASFLRVEGEIHRGH